MKMKNMFKTSALALMFIAIFSIILTVSADVNSEVKIQLDAGTNDCTLSGYDFSNTGVSSTEIDLGTLTNNMYCLLEKSTANTITINQNNLVGVTSGATIAKTNVTVSSIVFSKTGSLTYTTAFPSQNTWAAAQDMYVILDGEIGEASTDVTVGLKVPGGTQADTYAGDLVITVPNA